MNLQYMTACPTEGGFIGQAYVPKPLAQYTCTTVDRHFSVQARNTLAKGWSVANPPVASV